MQGRKQRISIDSKSVSITLFVPLIPKAIETARKDALICDKKAVEILENIDFDVRPYLQKRAYHSAIVRTFLLDREIRNFVHKNPKGLIINLGCGLDTRISRVDNGEIRWYDLDLPDVIALRRNFFSENNRIRFISKSVTDFSWINDIDFEKNDKIVLIAEGLLPYFNETEIKLIFEKIVNSFPGAEMYFTVVHNFLIGKEITEGTRFSWGIDKPQEVENLNPKLKVLNCWRSSDYFKSRQHPVMRILSLITPAGRNLNRLIHLKVT